PAPRARPCPRAAPRLAGAAGQLAPGGAAAPTCDIWQASYGGDVALLIRSIDGGRVRYTVLEVDGSLEQPQADAFIRAYAKGGTTIARFPSGNDALKHALSLCRDR